MKADARIDQAAQALQSLPPVQRALLGREQLIMSKVLGRQIGPREQRLMRLLYWSGQPGVITVSLLLLLKRIWAQRYLPVRLPIPKALFVGIDALRETNLRQDLRNRLSHDHVFVDQRQMDNFSVVGRLRCGPALKEWWGLLPVALACFRDNASIYDPLELRSTLAMRLTDLAHLLAQFRALHAEEPRLLIACSTADLSTHAACIVGFPVEYYQHGFLARTLIFPDIAMMLALTKIEGAHVASRVPGLLVRYPSVLVQKSSDRRVLAIAGTYGEGDAKPVNTLVRSALDQKLQVVIRPHPLGDDKMWQDVKELKGVIVEAKGNFDDFLIKWQPGFLASWFSTTLLDGLLAGAVPITLSDNRPNLVFPFDQISLAWPKDRLELQRSMIDEEHRIETLQRLAEVIA